MHLTRYTWAQLAVLAVVSVTALAYMLFDYMRLPSVFFGVGHYTVTVHLSRAAGLYERANVTYRGSDIGEVKTVRLNDAGVDAVLSLRSDVKIPADLEAEIHSTSAVGEQYIALLPRNANRPDLKDGDVITVANTRVPPDINSLLDATNRGLQAIPGSDLQTAIDESYTAVGGLGPDIGRLVKGSTALAIDSYTNLPDLLNVVDNLGPVLDTQTDTSDAVQAWAAHLATVTGQLRHHDTDLRGTITNGSAGAEAVRSLIERLQPAVPIIAANLASVAPVLVTYRPDLEQLLVLLPQGIADVQAIGLANRGTKQSYKGGYLSFNLNTNLPPPCTTGFLPVQQQRVASVVDYPDRPAGDLYCRVPQDSPFNVRGARNIPCETRPGKRAPTVKMCESDQDYVPLNDGLNWKGDPNATLSGQPIPQLSGSNSPAPTAGVGSPGAPRPATPIAAVGYDPATGTYVGPDGRVYMQRDLSHTAAKDKTWQSMLLPPPGS
jgi:phospholipid/cholesterol/gamma-HCH transport system substrate-binding protein